MITRLLQLPAFRHRVALAALACIGLAACQPSATVSTGANVPAAYSHVWVTLKQVAFNTSATAGPTDSGWQSFTLSSPQTIDLAAVTNGALAQFASSLSLSGGTYAQMRLVLTDSNVALTGSASNAGALYNDEVDYIDASGTSHRVPLQVPNSAQGVTFPVSLTIESAEQATLAAIACAATSSSSEGSGLDTTGSGTCEYGTQTASQCTTGSFYDSLIGTCVQVGGSTDSLLGTTTSGIGGTTSGVSSSSCAYGTTYDATTGSCIATSTGTAASAECSYDQVYSPVTGTCTASGLGTSAATSYVAVDFDASRDLVPYTVNGNSGFVLIPHLSGYNLSEVGMIEGQVDVSGLPATGIGGIQVTAETSNGTQNLIVASVPLQSSGTFVLYPLPCSSTSTATSTSDSSSSSSSAAYSCTAATQDYDLVIHGPGIQTVIVQSVPVTAGAPGSGSATSLGVTLTAASSYAVNLSAAASPPGSWIGFYQTLPNTSTAPYLIEAYPVDPFTGTFDTAQSLSSASIQYGVYASGSAISLSTVTPAEGASAYSVGASAPVYGNGPLSTMVAPSSSGATSGTFTVAAIPLPSTGESVSGTVSVTTPGKYDKGELLLTQGGALVAVASLDSYLGAASSSATLFTSVPGGTSTSIYYAEAWVWNSSNPAGTFSRQPVSTAIDVTTGNATGVAVTIN
ncbi:MAG TPA: DUF4382 domain-containing protein [Steroidobacteraceae bacterium]|nr:DUF4382 domain-containing protein [Steroidobacteraceae bacterium]